MDNRFLAMTKMCLNNWHYINKKILDYNDIVNFFTGHSGSGKSTVIDALQMIFYADTTGRGFFNKAAKEDSNRALIEYLRGMIRIEENNDIKYLRNKNFSSSVVLEFRDTETKKYQCIGVAFDVDTSNNNIAKQWFWHTGPIFEDHYRSSDNKPLTTDELKDFIRKNYVAEDHFLTTTDNKFRNEIYSSYFGGLPAERFIALFKKAIPFRMDMKLDDFIKNYIFTKVDIHIDDMKDNVAQYSNLKLKLEDTKKEIELLTVVQEQYQKYADCCDKEIQLKYNYEKLEIKAAEQNIQNSQLQLEAIKDDIATLTETSRTLETQISAMQKDRDEIAGFIQNSGYSHLEEQLKLLNENIEVLGRSKANYDMLAHNLVGWLKTELLEPGTSENIRQFEHYQADYGKMERIKVNIAEVKSTLSKEKEEFQIKIRTLQTKINYVLEEIEELKKGHKNYTHTLLEAKSKIEDGLAAYYNKPIQVDILADVIDVEDETWLNAVEGYMGGNKTTLIVHPEYAKKAMELYRGFEANKYHQVAVVDTEKVFSNARPALNNSLAEEVKTSSNYVRAYIDYLLGRVIKCDTIDELRANNSGITKDCVLYQGYKLQHIDPRNYTDFAYIGQGAIVRRLANAEENLRNLKAEKMPADQRIREISDILGLESFLNTHDYEQWRGDRNAMLLKEKEKQECSNKIEELKKTDIGTWQNKLESLDGSLISMRGTKSQADSNLMNKTNKQNEINEALITYNEEMIEKQRSFVVIETREAKYQAFLTKNEAKKLDHLKTNIQREQEDNLGRKEIEFKTLIDKRQAHNYVYNYRGFTVTDNENKEYDNQLTILSSEKLAEFTEKANRQAKLAIHHFKTDFVYKIRAAIVDAQKQKNDLNQVLDQLDFGKDKYSFSVTKNNGEEGKFYDMFMNKDLEINPTQLDNAMEGQEDLFSLNHESVYNDSINELLEMFMPPANSDTKTLEIARANIDRYSDYRTYLSFDMNQKVNGGPPMSLSKMLSKNSGGEGQNPLYVALLASFAQIYRINVNSKVKRRPTPRLVVLDEAFSKMDGEKVATCIALIKSLHVQAIISAPNDKIQNYTENVNKIFLFANQNKTHISIEEFEKNRFYELLENVDDFEGNIEDEE
ncbi:MAG: ATP-binding protein [Mobilitalea sp.]